MKKVVLAGLVASAICGVSAFAADVPVKAPAPMAVESFNWSGWYVGGEVGYADLKNAGSFDLPPIVLWHNKASTGIYGGILGAQWQMPNGKFVLGVEGDVAALFKKNSDHSACSPLIGCGPGDTLQTSITGPIWSAGGRLGLALGQVMPYVAGGYAETKIKHSFFDGTGALIKSTKHGQGGAYIGGGLDFALAHNWIFGVDYRHYTFGNRTDVPVDTTGAAVPGDIWSNRTKLDAVTARLTYKFDGWGKSPVVAKY